MLGGSLPLSNQGLVMTQYAPNCNSGCDLPFRASVGTQPLAAQGLVRSTSSVPSDQKYQLQTTSLPHTHTQTVQCPSIPHIAQQEYTASVPSQIKVLQHNVQTLQETHIDLQQQTAPQQTGYTRPQGAQQNGQYVQQPAENYISLPLQPTSMRNNIHHFTTDMQHTYQPKHQPYQVMPQQLTQQQPQTIYLQHHAQPQMQQHQTLQQLQMSQPQHHAQPLMQQQSSYKHALCVSTQSSSGLQPLNVQGLNQDQSVLVLDGGSLPSTGQDACICFQTQQQSRQVQMLQTPLRSTAHGVSIQNSSGILLMSVQGLNPAQ
jgi:hypothetical protein